jgi:BMFP domain-containing protein YqiC
VESKDIIQYFLEFNKGSFARLELVRRESQEGEYKVAIIARRLSAISKEIDVPGIESVLINLFRLD